MAELAWLAVPLLLVCAAGPLAAAGSGLAGPQPEEIVISVVPGTGAPGSGNGCLAEEMKSTLATLGVKLSETPSAPAYTVKGEADMTETRPGLHHIVTRWTIVAPDGKTLPKTVATDHDVAFDRLEEELCRHRKGYAIGFLGTAASRVLAAIRGEQPLEDEPIKRLRREVGLLFEQVLKEGDFRNREPGKCEFDIVWLDAPVPEELASKWLGVHVHASLTKEKPEINYQEALAPDGTLSEAFCGKVKRNNYRDGLERIIRTEGYKLGLPSNVYSSYYSFPIFDRNFRRAVIVAWQYGYGLSSHEFGGTQAVTLYVKRHGKWSRQRDKGSDEVLFGMW